MGTPTLYTPTVITHSSHLGPAVAEYWSKEGLTALWPSLVFAEYASDGGPNAWLQIPVQKGKKVHFWREPVPSISALLSTIGESAADPAPDELPLTPVTAECGVYGKHMVLSDQTLDVPLVRGVNVAARNKAFQAGRLFNALIGGVISANGTEKFAGSGKVSANQVMITDTLTTPELDKLAFYLQANNVRPYPDQRYKLTAHPACIKDLRADTGTDAMFQLIKYAMGSEMRETFKTWHVGDISGFKIMQSTEIVSVGSASISAGVSAADSGYYCLWAGYESVGAVSIAGSQVLPGPQRMGTGNLLKKSPRWDPRSTNFEIIVKLPSKFDTSNPLNRRATVGFKFFTAVKVLDSKRCGTLFCGSGLAPTG